MIDFDLLVIAPLMGVFGQPIVVTPTASQPGAAPFLSRGDLRIQNVDMPLQEGIMSVQIITIGLRKADFLVFVQPGDVLNAAGVDYVIDDTDDDPQGHSIITLKKVQP